MHESPTSADRLISLARDARRAGSLSGAIEYLQEAAELVPRNASILAELGACSLAAKNQSKAIEAFTELIRLQPSNPQGFHGLGLALKLTGSSAEAFHAFRRAAELDPEFLPACTELFGQSQHLLNWTEALPVLERGMLHHPQSIAMNVAVAVTCGKLSMASRAEELFRRASELGPIAGPPYAHWLQEEGRFEEAKEILLKSIRSDPTLGEAYHGLAIARCFKLQKGGLLEGVLSVLERNDLRPESRMFLLYAAAKAFEERQDFESAMRYYDLANRAAYEIHSAPLEIDREMADRSLERTRWRYPRELVQTGTGIGSISETPVFLVGMIRSGTTLLDQILASHRSIDSAGEQPFWVVNAPRMEFKWRNGEIQTEDIGKAAAKYLESLPSGSGQALRIVDKMPVNYRHLGLIRMAFPNARIIHLRRNPIDTCVSIYTTYLGNATYFAYHRDNIVRHYLEYMALMDYWRECLNPDRFLEVDYEDLVLAQEKTVRRIVAFLGLEWDDSCLRHHEGSRQVSTPSLYSARQAVHSNSVGRWRRYEPWLGKFKTLEKVRHEQ